MKKILRFSILAFVAAASVLSGFDVPIVVSPNVVNLDSKGVWVTVHAEISYSTVSGVSVSLNGIPVEVVKSDSRGELVAKFAIDDVKAILVPGTVMLTLEGTTVEGAPFTGSDEILVIQPQVGVIVPFVTVSGASFTPFTPLAPGVIAAGFGTELAASTEIAPSTGSLPIALAQTSVVIRDSAGVEYAAPLWFVSANQINYHIPEQTALGPATVAVIRDSQTVATGTLQIDTVAPGLFTMNANGQGVVAGLAVHAKTDGSQSWEYLFPLGCSVGSCVPWPIDLGPETDLVYLELYGTGIRGRSLLTDATATIGGVSAPVEYAGPVSDTVGLDQVNLRVPRSLIGRGEVDVVLTVDGKTANSVLVNIQ